MAYSTPVFNLVCDIYKGDPTNNFALKAFRTSSPCQLRGYGRHTRYSAVDFAPNDGILGEYCALLLPALTDVRDIACNGGSGDYVEVPSGSGRWYIVALVDDVAKGFANEYRFAALVKASQGSSLPTFPLWPTPIP